MRPSPPSFTGGHGYLDGGGHGLFRNEPITDVVRRLNLSADGEAGSTCWPAALSPRRVSAWGPPGGMALPPDRTDMGLGTLPEDDWHGLQLFAIDGAQFRTPENLSFVNIMALPTHPLSGRALPGYASGGVDESGKPHFAECVTAPYRRSETVLAHSMLATIRITPLRCLTSSFTA